MLKRLVWFFVACLTAGILFISCPIEYVPHVYLPRAPLGTWPHDVHVPEDFNGTLEGTALGWGFLQIPVPARPFNLHRVVTVTFHFLDGRVNNVEVCYEWESYYEAFVANAVAAWKARVQAHGILGITPELERDEETPLDVPANPYHYRWTRANLSAFSGATITVNALTEAARNALERLDSSDDECENTGCDCSDCAGETCTCDENDTECGNMGCDCSDCAGETCTCDETGTGLVSFTGRSPGFSYRMGFAPAYVAVVEVTLYFYSDDMDTIVDISICTGWESGGNLGPDTPYGGFYTVSRGWATLIREGGIQAVPDVLPFDYAGLSSERHLWPPGADAFTGSTITINALRRAAQSALDQRP